ncbi:MAG: TonB-dependent receptor [Bacteroidota bacterium]
MKKTLLLSLSLWFCFPLFAQQLTSTIRGRVISDTQEPLAGVKVFVSNLPSPIGTFTDSLGKFRLENVPVGRRTLEAKLVGYSEFVRDNINLNSARVYDLEIELQTGINMEAVVVNAYVRNDPINEMSILSARRIDPEELQFHAATANDPGRLVQGMPGVQNGLDVRNDVVIRGNSPIGVLWRLEGIDIPNPNHYAGAGSSGGGITIFSASMLGSSDFSTGAFAAEYGNATAGVFDMKFRKGNMEEREHSFRAGLLGLDFATEGPIKKGKSSYLANFRYSTLGVLNQLGVYLLDPRNDNNFYDLSFKIHHQGDKDQFSLWGMGGLSTQLLRPAEQPWSTYRDYYIYDYGTQMGVLGGSWRKVVDSKSFIQVNAAYMAQNPFTIDDTLNLALDTGRVKTERYITRRASVSAFYKRSFSNQLSLKAGILASQIDYDLLDEKWIDSTQILRTVIDARGQTWQAQPYAQFSYRPTDRLTFNAGLHTFIYGLTNETSVEPRVGMKAILSNSANLAIGYGLHSKTVPFGNYFILVDNQQPNLDLSLMKSHHFVVAFDQVLKQKFRIHLEAYYQHLYDLPVTTEPDRKIFILNRLWGFDADRLESVGTGRNYGFDFSIEKFFDKGSFFVISGSWLNATFQRPGDDTRYRSNYDARFSSNFTGGQVFPLGENTFLETGLRFIYNSGFPITPLIPGQESNDGYDQPFDFSRPNIDQLPSYFRPDMRIALRRNRPGYAWWLALDIQNFIARNNNLFTYQFNRDTDQWEVLDQSPLTPVISFQIDF